MLANTHLLFPHQPYFSIIRLRELCKILGYLELYLQQVQGWRVGALGLTALALAALGGTEDEGGECSLVEGGRWRVEGRGWRV